MNIEQVKLTQLTPYARNSRSHSPEQINQIAASIREFGFTNPVLIDQNGEIIAGHGRVLAARQLGLAAAPCIRLSHLSPTQKRAYIIADNKLAENSEWSEDLLNKELAELRELDFDIDLLGFEELELAVEKQQSAPQIDTWEFSEVYEPFWIVIRGPVQDLPEVQRTLNTLTNPDLVVEVSV